MDAWDNFFLGQLGASAALGGLIFVGVSINLGTIMQSRRLLNRALEALLILLGILVLSSLALVPGQPVRAFGAEVLVTALVVWTFLTRLHLGALRTVEPAHRRTVVMAVALAQASALSLIIGGLLIALAVAGATFWLVAGTLLGYVVVFANAWVLLVEINR